MNDIKLSPEEIKARLDQNIGTSQWYRHTSTILYTDGVQEMAELCEAYWLIDAICFNIIGKRRLRSESFINCVLTVTENEESRSAELKFDDGNDYFLYKQDIPATDFPLKEIQFFFINNVLLLPSEY